MTDINEIIGRAAQECALEIGSRPHDIGAAVVKALGEAGYVVAPQELPQSRIDAAMDVDWVDNHVFEFFGTDEAENRKQMGEHIVELWNVLTKAP